MPKKDKSRATLAAIASGIFFLSSGITGEGMWVFLRDISGIVVNHVLLDYLFMGMIAIASLGGLAIIAGAVFIFRSSFRTGRTVISLGTGLGVLEIVIAFAIWFLGGHSPVTVPFILGITGLALSMYSRSLV